MTTAAAIDRVVHHATILELNGPSIRAEEAQKRNQETIKFQEESTDEDSRQKSKKRPKGGAKGTK